MPTVIFVYAEHAINVGKGATLQLPDQLKHVNLERVSYIREFIGIGSGAGLSDFLQYGYGGGDSRFDLSPERFEEMLADTLGEWDPCITEFADSLKGIADEPGHKWRTYAIEIFD